MRLRGVRSAWAAAVAGVLLLTTLWVPGDAARADAAGLDSAQKAAMLTVAKDTWKFFENDLDPVTG
ncbi:MAG: hypothetical protein J2P23_05055, partial [Microlunatus sp.]|nr:hypothetical protein [Microlunatus sp.]